MQVRNEPQVFTITYRNFYLGHLSCTTQSRGKHECLEPQTLSKLRPGPGNGIVFYRID